MTDTDVFLGRVESYRRYRGRGLLAVDLITGAYFGFGLAMIPAVLSSLGLYVESWIIPVLFLLPLIFQGVMGFLRSRDSVEALIWLDRQRHGKQEVLAAWEQTLNPGPLEGPVLRQGLRFFNESEETAPRPTPKPMALVGLVVSFLLVLFFSWFEAPQSVFGNRYRDMGIQGRELEDWARSWAERTDAEGLEESRELAERMSELGRRMSENSISRRQAENALKRLEEDVEERQRDILRDTLAQAQRDDLDVDRDSSQLFDVRPRSIPSDDLATLRDSISRLSPFSDGLQEDLERLFNDPEFRNAQGDGTPELTEELEEALREALESSDSELNDLGRASDEISEAQAESQRTEENGSPEQNDSSRNAEGSSELDQGASGDAGEGPSTGGGGQRRAEDFEAASSGDGAGGSGQGESPAPESQGENPPNRGPAEAYDPMELSSDSSSQDQSWRTVVRAYAEQDGLTIDEIEIETEWEKEVETAIRRENISPGARTWVMDYFIALEEGLDAQNGSTQ